MESGALEQTLANTLRDEQGRAERGALGRQLVQQRFTWGAVAEALVNLYNSLAVSNRKNGKPQGA
jgi:glycosyltransferase involved in cell wall biosynthesis